MAFLLMNQRRWNRIQCRGKGISFHIVLLILVTSFAFVNKIKQRISIYSGSFHVVEYRNIIKLKLLGLTGISFDNKVSSFSLKPELIANFNELNFVFILHFNSLRKRKKVRVDKILRAFVVNAENEAEREF